MKKKFLSIEKLEKLKEKALAAVNSTNKKMKKIGESLLIHLEKYKGALEVKDNNNEMLIHKVTKLPDIEALTILVNHGIDINSKGAHSFTSLQIALINENFAAATFLAINNAKVSFKEPSHYLFEILIYLHPHKEQILNILTTIEITDQLFLGETLSSIYSNKRKTNLILNEIVIGRLEKKLIDEGLPHNINDLENFKIILQKNILNSNHINLDSQKLLLEINIMLNILIQRADNCLSWLDGFIYNYEGMTTVPITYHQLKFLQENSFFLDQNIHAIIKNYLNNEGIYLPGEKFMNNIKDTGYIFDLLTTYPDMVYSIKELAYQTIKNEYTTKLQEVLDSYKLNNDLKEVNILGEEVMEISKMQ